MTIFNVMTGLPASGKSTLARNLDAMRFNLDDYRQMMGFADSWTRDKEDVAVKAFVAAITAAVDAGADVTADNTHLVRRLPNLYKQAMLGRDVEFVVHDLTGVSIAECIERDAKRTVGHVGEAVIWKLVKSAQAAAKSGWKLTSEWMNDRPVVEPYVEDPSLPWCVIFDIDGTLALHVARGPYEFEKVETDAVNEWVAGVHALYMLKRERQQLEIILLSGRKGEFREHTERWLTKHQLFYSELHMRPVDDPGRPDDVVKLELFDQHIRGRYNVEAVFDDRNRVVNLWRRLGLGCAQVADGAF